MYEKTSKTKNIYTSLNIILVRNRGKKARSQEPMKSLKKFKGFSMSKKQEIKENKYILETEHLGTFEAEVSSRKPIIKLLEGLTEPEDEKQYRTKERAINLIDDIRAPYVPLILKVSDQLLNVFSLGFLFKDSNYKWADNFDNNINVSVKSIFGVKSVSINFKEASGRKTNIFFSSENWERVTQYLQLVDKSEEVLRECYFNDSERDLQRAIEAMKEDNRRTAHEVKPIDEINPVHYIYQREETGDYSKEDLEVMKEILFGSQTNPFIIQMYQEAIEKIVSEGKKEKEMHREAQAERIAKIKENEDYFMEDLLF